MSKKSINLDELLSCLHCPVSHTLFSDPVVAHDGQTYDSLSLVNHRSFCVARDEDRRRDGAEPRGFTSPMTNSQMTWGFTRTIMPLSMIKAYKDVIAPEEFAEWEAECTKIKEDVEYIKELEGAAAEGDGDACFFLGMHCLTGTRRMIPGLYIDVHEDAMSLAVEHFKRGHELGNPFCSARYAVYSDVCSEYFPEKNGSEDYAESSWLAACAFLAPAAKLGSFFACLCMHHILFCEFIARRRRCGAPVPDPSDWALKYDGEFEKMSQMCWFLDVWDEEFVIKDAPKLVPGAPWNRGARDSVFKCFSAPRGAVTFTWEVACSMIKYNKLEGMIAGQWRSSRERPPDTASYMEQMAVIPYTNVRSGSWIAISVKAEHFMPKGTRFVFEGVKVFNRREDFCTVLSQNVQPGKNVCVRFNLAYHIHRASDLTTKAERAIRKAEAIIIQREERAAEAAAAKAAAEEEAKRKAEEEGDHGAEEEEA